MLREGKGMGNLRLVIPGNPGNYIKARLNSRFDLFSCLDQPSAKLKIMIVFPVLIPGQNFLFPGTGREITKCHGKGREIWGLYSRESGETEIPAHLWQELIKCKITSHQEVRCTMSAPSLRPSGMVLPPQPPLVRFNPETKSILIKTKILYSKTADYKYFRGEAHDYPDDCHTHPLLPSLSLHLGL